MRFFVYRPHVLGEAVTTPDLIVDGARVAGVEIGAERLVSANGARVGPRTTAAPAAAFVAADPGILLAPAVVLAEGAVVTAVLVARCAWRVGDVRAVWDGLRFALDERALPVPGALPLDRPLAGELIALPLAAPRPAPPSVLQLAFALPPHAPLTFAVTFAH